MGRKVNLQPLPEVVCLVFFKDGKLLLEQRIEEDNFKGRWTFTGGKVEKKDFLEGKDYKELAALREGGEETGLQAKSFQCFVSFEGISRNGGRFIFHGILITEWEGLLENKEPHKRNLDWITIEEAATFIGDTEVDKKILETFCSLFKR